MMTTSDRSITDISALSDIDLNTDALHDVLSDSRRRFVIAYLYEHEIPMAVADVADALASWETDSDSKPSQDQVKSVYASLYHVHLPKMVDVGVIEYERDRNVIALAVHSEEITKAVKLPPIG